MLYKCQASIILNICVKKNFKEIKFSERNRSHDLRVCLFVCFLTSESRGRETLKKTDDKDKRHGHIMKFCNEVVLRYSEWDQFPRSILGLFVCVLSCLVVSNSFVTPWTAAYQAPPSMGFSRQEYWSGCHCLLRLMRAVVHKSFLHWHHKSLEYIPSIRCLVASPNSSSLHGLRYLPVGNGKKRQNESTFKLIEVLIKISLK